ncbi:uncharacterized protein LOC27208866 [Drosophila simulans]|uniref:Uncharacterized protein n=1 Tax=Drosophila simulans TaxID=7240 RepID=A0A0J9U5S9_DROSI|nr:uncharacterized protein LOC27208866 [Drosophila simulans]KMY94975.1 uncharacterized protein Dsimw501_GD29023 [Drosophila simulans]
MLALTLVFAMQLLLLISVLLLLPLPGFSRELRQPYRYDRYDGNPGQNQPRNLERN